MTMKKEDREYAARVIEGIISDKQSKGCANSCIECSKDSKGCARDPGGFDWKYKGILEKAIEFLRKPEPVNEKKELKEAKRLLKIAVEDFKEINSNILTCKYCKWNSEDTDDCAYYHGDVPCEKICGWKHEGEALALIGEGGDTECQDTE